MPRFYLQQPCLPVLPKELSTLIENAVAQNIHDKEEAGEEDEAKQAHPSLDSHAHR
ncbi:unnamed protein product [Camellia sinensis]